MNRSRVSELNRTRIGTLHPFVQLKVGEFLATCEERLGIICLVISGSRTFAEQMMLYAQGRYGPTKDGKKVTWSRYSWHCFGLACDYAPLKEKPSGEFVLDWMDEDYLIPAYVKCREIAAQIGFGLLSLKRDKPHLQWTGGWTIRELLSAGYGKNLPISEIPLPKRMSGDRDETPT